MAEQSGWKVNWGKEALSTLLCPPPPYSKKELDMVTENKVEILIVDDDEGHSELIRSNLKKTGINNHIQCLTDGRTAVDFVLRHGKFSSRPANPAILVLMDINMPGELDGIAALKLIKNHPVGKSTPVIMLTTTDDPREISRCYEIGCNIYITKPVESVKFTEAVTRLGMFISIVTCPSEK